MKRIILTCGGTAGHVTPNIALLPTLRERGYDIHYIGSYEGMEKKLIEEQKVPYHGISSGKLRRYFDPKNFSDPFRVIKGYNEANRLMKSLKPDVVFSKGGFVSVPVILAAKHNKIPAIIHESDMTPGLANKISIPSATKVCCNFPEAMKHIDEKKAVLTGTPIRQELLSGTPEEALAFTGLSPDKPTLLIIGGSSGSVKINEAIRESIYDLLSKYQVIHLCGKGNVDTSYNHLTGYRQYEYIKKELSSMLALADVVISRAGANAICELQAIAKPNILIPLGLNASRGDQILNAASFEKQGFSFVLQEEDMTKESLLSAVDYVMEHKEDYKKAMRESKMSDAITVIADLIDEAAGNKKNKK